MWSYDVWIGSERYHGKTPLTYAFDQKLERGAIVRVPLQHQETMGVVAGRSAKKLPSQLKQISATAPGATLTLEQLQLLDWLMEYYPAPSGLITKLFLPPQWPHVEIVVPAEKEEPTDFSLPPLTSEQEKTLRAITQQSPIGSTVVLHGDTGSGKTRVYIELARQVLAKGRSVVILTPEIGLTPQLEQVFSAAFPGAVQVLHSNLSVGKRQKIWQILLGSSAQVLIGPRSALFAPLKNIGLVVVDEAHDSSYKQEQSPYYQTTRVATKLAQLYKAYCIFGSATPSVTDYYYAQAKATPILRMTTQAAQTIETVKTTVKTIDLKDKAAFVRSKILSESLISEMEKTLHQKQQSLIFLNRRGTARLTVCENCGWLANCPRCDLPLTYHGDEHRLRCHICGYHAKPPTSCPICNKTTISLQSIGTKSVVDELSRLFPQTTINRFDSDNKASEKLEKQYQNILVGNIDILVGTQILAKGLNLPRLSLVGIVIADTSLFVPDFTAEEQTFQLLTQVMGRLSRRDIDGTLVVQTFNPKSPPIQAALQKDWNKFYTQQLAERQSFGFPPFVYLLQLEYTAMRQQTVITNSEKLVAKLHKDYPRLTILGPAPCFHEKVRGKYRWQIIVKAKQRTALTSIIHSLPSGWRYNIDPTNLL